jgi:hypothetical protein
MIRLVFWTSAVLALTSAPALAQTASTATRLSGVTVTAPSATLPKVVSTFPADGKSVASGALIVKVTFDQKMNPEGWDYGKGADAYPSCLARPRLLPDEKTFILLCTASSDGRFSITLNNASGGFENLAGQKATPATFSFTTDHTTLVTIPEAMKAAGLKPDQGPVMDSRPAALAAVAH